MPVPQEMQQIFVTPDSIYAQLWDLARKPKDGQDVASHWKEMVAQQVHWAMLIQACAPGSSVSGPRVIASFAASLLALRH